MTYRQFIRALRNLSWPLPGIIVGLCVGFPSAAYLLILAAGLALMDAWVGFAAVWWASATLCGALIGAVEWRRRAGYTRRHPFRRRAIDRDRHPIRPVDWLRPLVHDLVCLAKWLTLGLIGLVALTWMFFGLMMFGGVAFGGYDLMGMGGASSVALLAVAMFILVKPGKRAMLRYPAAWGWLLIRRLGAMFDRTLADLKSA